MAIAWFQHLFKAHSIFSSRAGLSKNVSLCGQLFSTLLCLEKQGVQHPGPHTLFRTLLEA
jgi:hypothetical protein